MKNFQFNLAKCICLVFLLVAFSSAVTGKRVSNVNYKINGTGACIPSSTLPGECIAFNTGVVCTTTVGSDSKSWYQEGTCVVPYYMIP